MTNEKAVPLHIQDAWLAGYKGEPIADFHKRPADWRDAYARGKKTKVRDMAHRPALDAAIAEVRARRDVQDA